MDDRTVHAVTLAGGEVVRYDRAGKWYVEGDGWHTRIGFWDAVQMALAPGSKVYLGLPGGSRFDAAVRKRLP